MRNNTSVIYNVCLVIGDFLALVVAFMTAYILRVTLDHRVLSVHISARTYLAIFLTLLPFWILIFGLLGLYNAKIYEKRFSELGRLIVGCFIGVLFAISYAYIANVAIFPGRLVTVYGFGLALFLVFLFRTIARGLKRELFSYGLGINGVLLVGDTRTSHVLIRSLADTKITGYKVLGVVGGIKHPLKPGSPHRLYVSFEEAISDLQGEQFQTIIQTELYASAAKNDAILAYAQEHHIAYRFVPGNGELFTGNLTVDLFHSVPIIAVHQTAVFGWGRVVKRLFDIVAGSVALLVASPFMLLIGLAIKLSDPGRVLFRQARVSRFDSSVDIYKFRTHKLAYNGLSPEAAFAKMGRQELSQQYRDNGDQLPNDPRVTPIGRWLRRTSLDELPQLFNVIRGDISLVGPRALVASELEHFAQKNLILSVKSGLTGLAQISGRRDINFAERRKLDLYYVQNWSFWGDVVILLKTVWMVLFHRGAI